MVIAMIPSRKSTFLLLAVFSALIWAYTWIPAWRESPHSLLELLALAALAIVAWLATAVIAARKR